jgi:hypothetical protein
MFTLCWCDYLIWQLFLLIVFSTKGSKVDLLCGVHLKQSIATFICQDPSFNYGLLVFAFIFVCDDLSLHQWHWHKTMNSNVIESINYSSRLVQSLSSKVHLSTFNQSFLLFSSICPLWFSFHLFTFFIHPTIVHVSHSFAFNSSILSSSFFIYLIFLHIFHP